jgi:autotransporter translocation and assembly factor TamB
VRVKLVSIPANVAPNAEVPFAIELSGPAPQGGVTVNLTGPQLSVGGAPISAVAIAAGLATTLVSVTVAGSGVIIAQIPGTPAATCQATVE